MAIGTPTERYAVNRTAQTTTTTLSPATTIVAGRVAIMCAASAAKLVASVADDVGNTWIVDRVFTGNSRSVSFVSCQVVTQITGANVITITWDVATSLACQIWIQEVTGLAAASVFDTSATGTAASGTAVSTSATATLAQAEEIVFGGFRTQNVSTWTPGATYTNVTTPLLNTNAALEYKIVAATTGVLADGTFSVSGTWGGVVATYKGAVVAGAENPYPYVGGGYFPTEG